MDTFSSYNQILMAKKDKEMTTFITESRMCQYLAMPSGLKNASATCQRLLNKIFKHYDMLIKSNEQFEHVKDLQEAFDVVKK